DFRRGPGSGTGTRDQVEAIARPELDLAIGEALDPDFRPRQVAQDADLAPDPLAGLAHGLGAGELRSRVAMREVEPDYVDASAQQRVEHAGRVGRRAEGGKDLGTSQRYRHGMLPRGCGSR